MTTAQVNYLNIGLMLISAIAAFIIPFELFLFSYAFLGPLHYLTEISWLHKRNYFTKGKRDFIFLLILCFFILVFSYIRPILSWFFPVDAEGNFIDIGITNIAESAGSLTPTLIFLSFGAALIMILVKSNTFKVISYSLLFLLGLAMHSSEFYLVLFAVFLPTLIHVFIFTGAFILVGALKGKSVSGYFSIFIFLLCAVSFFILFRQPGYVISDYAQSAYNESFFSLNYTVFEWLMPHMLEGVRSMDGLRDIIYNTSSGILITRFIAYAYTYHYLNWFSKTSVIKWHEISRPGLAIIIVLWVAAVVLYSFDYRTGLTALYFLSFLHVLLEFPLNFQSFKQIGEQVKLRFRSAG